MLDNMVKVSKIFAYTSMGLGTVLCGMITLAACANMGMFDVQEETNKDENEVCVDA